MRRVVRHICSIIAVLCLPLLSYPQLAGIEPQLRDHYQGKIWVLRGFYSGAELRYDSKGSLAGAAASGDWTTEGFVQVNELRITGQRLAMGTKRLFVVAGNDKGFRFVENPYKRAKRDKWTRLEIEIDLGTDAPAADVLNAALAKVFLTSDDDFAKIVPEYWKPCVVVGLMDKDKVCKFSPEFTAIPGLRSHPENSASIAGAEARDTSLGVVPRSGSHVTPPKPIHFSEPKFSAVADHLKWRGVVTVDMIVDKTGVPTDIHVLRPLGCGLDMEAVRNAALYRFKPAEKDGHPVAVRIALETDFHRYD